MNRFHNKSLVVALLLAFGLTNSGPSLADVQVPTAAETLEFRQELAHLESIKKALDPPTRLDLGKYQKNADEILRQWGDKNKEYYARLVWEICAPLSSGSFKDNQAYELAREYALSALKNADAIPIYLETQLTGHVTSFAPQPKPWTEEEFAERRKEDVEVRLHAWIRRVDAIDPNWDPDEKLSVHAPLPPSVSGFPGMAPDAIKDPVLRAQYEAAIKENQRRKERHSQQFQLRNWLKNYPAQTEKFIVQAYSKPPANVAELTKLLDRYMSDQATRQRILDAVAKRRDNANK